MKWKTTWLLLGLAAVLFGFILLIERRIPDVNLPPARLVTFQANDVTNIQLRLTNQLALRVERSRADTPWQLTVPIVYPAQPFAIEWLIQALEQVVPQTEISPAELKASRRTIAEFGLDIPQATLTLQHNGQRTEIYYGSKTPVGDGVYVQVLNQPGIYVIGSELVDRLPRSHNDWRDTALFSSRGFSFNRMEVRSGRHSFTIDLDPTNRAFVLSKPTLARADAAKVDALLRRLLSTQILRFVSDSPRVDLEPFGLQSPEAEVSFLI